MLTLEELEARNANQKRIYGLLVSRVHRLAAISDSLTAPKAPHWWHWSSRKLCPLCNKEIEEQWIGNCYYYACPCSYEFADTPFHRSGYTNECEKNFNQHITLNPCPHSTWDSSWE